MSAETEFENLFNNDDTRGALAGAMLVIMDELSSQWKVSDANSSPRLFHRRVDYKSDGYFMAKKDAPRNAVQRQKDLGIQKLMFADVVNTIPSKSPVEQKQIALQLLGYQLDQSKEPLHAEQAAIVVSKLLEALGIQSTEINSLRDEVASFMGVKDRLASLEDKLENRLDEFKTKTVFYGTIAEACDEILKRVRINEKLQPIERTFPVKGRDACKAFLDEYVFYENEDYTVDALHENYRKVKN